VGAEHRNRIGFRPVVVRGRGQPQRGDVIDHASQRGPCRARYVLLGDIEQRGDGVEITVGLRPGRPTAPAGA
jgi:hypothetical protein